MNSQLTPGTYLETCWAFADGTFLPYMSLFLKNLAVRTKCKSIKVMDQGDWKTDLLSWILPGQNDQPSNRHKIWRRDHSFEDFMHSHGYKTTVFVMWKYRAFVGAIKYRWTSGWYIPVLFNYIILEWGRLLTKHIWRGAYWKEGAKSNHGFGGHLDG